MSYNTNYTYEEIESVLNEIKSYIKEDKYQVSMNSKRKENREFNVKYNLNSKMRKEVLLGIKVEDFCYTLNNEHKNYEHEILYVFAPKIKFPEMAVQSGEVTIYVKINLIKDECAVIISFHELNYPIKYLFRKECI